MSVLIVDQLVQHVFGELESFGNVWLRIASDVAQVVRLTDPVGASVGYHTCTTAENQLSAVVEVHLDTFVAQSENKSMACA